VVVTPVVEAATGAEAAVATEDRSAGPRLDGFTYDRVEVAPGVHLQVATAGSGPPVLLLHGYPQTHLIWSRVAPELARTHTVVVPDLRGYGDSDKPAPDADGPDDAAYSKRVMAADLVSLMSALGHDRYAVVGHDRGGRVGHRLTLDSPEHVDRLAVLDIVPTLHAFEHVDRTLAHGYFHWFFLAAGGGIPETMLAGDPEAWVRLRVADHPTSGEPLDPALLDDYVRCFADRATIAASCADYRAAAGIDLVHDRADRDAGRRLTRPVLALWGAHGFVGTTYDVLATWAPFVADGVELTGRALACDHYVPEQAPEQTLAAVREFLT